MYRTRKKPKTSSIVNRCKHDRTVFWSIKTKTHPVCVLKKDITILCDGICDTECAKIYRVWWTDLPRAHYIVLAVEHHEVIHIERALLRAVRVGVNNHLAIQESAIVHVPWFEHLLALRSFASPQWKAGLNPVHVETAIDEKRPMVSDVHHVPRTVSLPSEPVPVCTSSIISFDGLYIRYDCSGMRPDS